MFSRFAVSSIVVCGLLVAGLVGGADAAPRSKAKGRTAQGYRVTLKMRGDRSFKIVAFKADLECRDGTLLQLEEGGFLPTIVRPNGTFHEMQYGSTDRVYIRGRVGKNSVQGRLRLRDRYGKGNPCKSRWIKFHAS